MVQYTTPAVARAIRAYFARFNGDPVLVNAMIDAGPKEVTAGGTLFFPLPQALRRPFSDADPATGLGPCACRYCSPVAHVSQPNGCWDTCAASSDGESVWQPHHPALNGALPKRAKD